MPRLSQTTTASLFLTLLLSGAMAPATAQTGPAPAGAEAAANPSFQDTLDKSRVEDGARLLSSGKPADAISEDLDKVIADFEAKFGASKGRVYAARGQVETMSYLAEAAKQKVAADVVPEYWAYAYFLKAYALIELGRADEGKHFLDRAVELSPHNAQFLTETANWYQRKKDWNKALEWLRQAEVSAQEYSLTTQKNLELGRVWRSMGYVDVETLHLADAEDMYLKCLDLNSADKGAAKELQYVRTQRLKQVGNPDGEAFVYKPAGAVFPNRIGDYQRVEVQNLEAATAGEGVRVRYINPGKFTADVSVFDHKLDPVPSSLTDPVIVDWREKTVQRTLALAKQDLSILGGAGDPRKMFSLNSAMDTQEGKTPYLLDSFVVYPQGRAVNEDRAIWLAKGKIWSARVTRIPGSVPTETTVDFFKALIPLSVKAN